MERSEQIGELIAALAKAQAEFTPALKENEAKIKGQSKTGNAYEYGYKYADLAANIGAVRPALNKHGIALMHFNESDLERQVASVTCSLHLGEQFVSISVEAPAIGQNGFNVQSLGACWTYLRRYTLQALCGLATEDDDGASVATDNKPIPSAIKKEFPSAEVQQQWANLFRECDTLDKFNTQVIPLAKEKGKEFIAMMAEEARRRHYIGERSSGLYRLETEDEKKAREWKERRSA